MVDKMNVYEYPQVNIVELEVEQAVLSASGDQNEGWDILGGNE